MTQRVDAKLKSFGRPFKLSHFSTLQEREGVSPFLFKISVFRDYRDGSFDVFDAEGRNPAHLGQAIVSQFLADVRF